MDEEGFGQKSSNKRVIYVQGQISLLGKTAETLFHVTIFDYVSTSNHAPTPCSYLQENNKHGRGLLLLFERKHNLFLPRGLINPNILLQRNIHFNDRMPSSAKRPVMMIFDGCPSHYNYNIIKKAIKIRVILVLLPQNATHPIKTLYIEMVNTFKETTNKKIEKQVIETILISLNKRKVIGLYYKILEEG